MAMAMALALAMAMALAESDCGERIHTTLIIYIDHNPTDKGVN